MEKGAARGEAPRLAVVDADVLGMRNEPREPSVLGDGVLEDVPSGAAAPGVLLRFRKCSTVSDEDGAAFGGDIPMENEGVLRVVDEFPASREVAPAPSPDFPTAHDT